jgi:hypothetical protein
MPIVSVTLKANQIYCVHMVLILGSLSNIDSFLIFSAFICLAMHSFSGISAKGKILGLRREMKPFKR